jgi:hypothetical protein
MNKLSLLYTYQGKYGEAGGLCREALAILQRNLGANAPAVNSTARRCSELADLMDREDEIEKMQTRARALAPK